MLLHRALGRKPIGFIWILPSGLQRQPDWQVVKKPSTGRTRFILHHACGVDCQIVGRVMGIFGKIDSNKLAGYEVLDNQMAWHPAPTHSSQQEVQSSP